MILLPAIDLFEQKAVRLYKGDYAQMTVYSDAPLQVAKDFAAAGASWIHMVDLQGARDGGSPNLELVAAVAEETGLRIEIGGGIRSLETAEKYLQSGVARVILGTAAVTDEGFLREALQAFGPAVAVGADVKDGFVAIRGWREQSDYSLESFVEKMQGLGVQTLICTDISRDGAMRGTNRALYRELLKCFSLRLIASGGVSSLEDICALRDLGLYGAILGKAYYTGAVKLAEALEAAK